MCENLVQPGWGDEKMRTLICFACAHTRASSVSPSTTSRAAKPVNVSAVTPASRTASVAKTASHHSAGMLLRCHHFETVHEFAPMAAAAASLEGQSSITERNELISVMPQVLGQSVLKGKANLSLDGGLPLGHTVRMADSDEEVQFKQEFMQRIAQARIARGWKQWQAAEAMGIPQDKYKQYEGRSLMPHYLIGRFCLVTRVDPVWLMTGRGEKPMQPPKVVADAPPAAVRNPKRAKSKRRAA